MTMKTMFKNITISPSGPFAVPLNKRFVRKASVWHHHLDSMVLDADLRMRDVRRLQREVMRRDMLIKELESHSRDKDTKIEKYEIKIEKLERERESLIGLHQTGAINYDI